MKLVTLTSDFGLEGEGPGIMEATIAGLCPGARVVHLCHAVAPFNVLEGARQMECVLTISAGIHVCVVDPGVGSQRRGIALDVPSVGVLIGPDNGVLMSLVRLAGGLAAAYSIDNPDFMRQPVSSTFHGRDVFASVAGHLAAGADLSGVGAPVPPSQLVAAPYEEAAVSGSLIESVVLHINRFGNCILNIREEQMTPAMALGRAIHLYRNEQPLGQALVAPSFSYCAIGSPLIYPDSYGRVGLALNQGNAASRFGLEIGSPLTLRWEAER